MIANKRLTDEGYEALSIEYEQNPPELSGNPGFITNIREQSLVSELLPPDYARIVRVRAEAMSISPAEVIMNALKAQLVQSL